MLEIQFEKTINEINEKHFFIFFIRDECRVTKMKIENENEYIFDVASFAITI